jgi:2-amino-4-hydroxy-6-hydroxymethyldihydropteridine diphosphokinase
VEVSQSQDAAARRDANAFIIVALGGNLAEAGRDVGATLEAALRVLPAAGVAVWRRSRLWRSKAWPDPDAPAFLNAVALVDTALDPEALLLALHDVEARFGRRRGSPNAPRTLDLDVVAYGRKVARTDTLVLPHPRAAERRFVMGPLAELAPRWRHPTDGRTAAELADAAPIGRDAVPI